MKENVARKIRKYRTFHGILTPHQLLTNIKGATEKAQRRQMVHF